MKRLFILLFILSPHIFLNAQPKVNARKYPSLLWEISGNGMKKPSWLFGTMHVSSKTAFHLADSFYMGIRQADVVALETNPESWQEDMSKYDVDYNTNPSNSWRNNSSIPDDYLTISTLKFFDYDKRIERSLSSNPSVINNLLYRTYGNESSDFEENTYLDMYIYQCGKKWGKKVTGVERYGESMKLMSEAYKDAAKDKDKKERSFDGDDNYSQDKIQEAYRNGNLDLLDSINKFNSFSSAFDEKFLYRRNEIQANSIDSILKSDKSLFVGVGAAHLPGNRGVIELLRRKGYHLRPIKMGERDSRDKESVEKVRVPVAFTTQTAVDGFFKVDVPGKLYKYSDDHSISQQQYADMANGSYYIVTRMMTNAWMWGQNEDAVYKKVDSLLYENVPGKIINKQAISKNGYKGFDITNRTRRGDLQRYNIFITPFEVIFFKISGNGDYIKEGDEADRFFNSIQLKDYKQATAWQNYSPLFGGFSVSLPHDPYIGNDGSFIYDAADKNTNTQYRVMRTDIHNFHFVEEDTFDLGLMDESFAASGFIDKELSRKQTTYKGYPALDCKYKAKNGSIYLTRFIIQGPHYYSLIAYGKQENQKMQGFLNSFEIRPYIYKEPKEQTDTSLYFTVKTPVYFNDKKEKIDMPQYNFISSDDEDESEDDQLEGGVFRNKIIADDSTGEKIYVSFFRSPRYQYLKDSTGLEKNYERSLWGDTTLVLKDLKKYLLPGGMKVWEKTFTDRGSSRILKAKNFNKNGMDFILMAESDSLSHPSAFIDNFFDSFAPADTLKGVDPFSKKTSLFFEDFFSKDSIAHERAVKGIAYITFDSADLRLLKKAISSMNWNEKKYLETKSALIEKLKDIKTNASADLLHDIYFSANDTVKLQYVALEILLEQQTPYSFEKFKNIVDEEPPVLDNGTSTKNYNITYSLTGFKASSNYGNGSFLDELNDSLQLTKTIIPGLLPLLNLDDYKYPIMNLLAQMIDSGLLKPDEYKEYFPRFLIEAKQELRKQSIAETRKEIEKAEKEKNPQKYQLSYDNDDPKDEGNEDLSLYATLLLPFWETDAGVPAVIEKMLKSGDKLIRYNTMISLIRNNKPYPDSLLNYFASLDEYRYQLYTDLKTEGRLNIFPAKYDHHIDLAKSYLLNKKSYSRPDSLVYVDSLFAESKNKKGFVYFFKYKEKKDDVNWKIATVGIMDPSPKIFEFADSEENRPPMNWSVLTGRNLFNQHDLAKFTDTKIKDDEPVTGQLKKLLKRLLYSQRKSARDFYYDTDNSDRDDLQMLPGQ